MTFTIVNIRAVPHELMGFRSDLDSVAYPRQKDGEVNEEGKGIVSATDGEDIEPAGNSDARDRSYDPQEVRLHVIP